MGLGGSKMGDEMGDTAAKWNSRDVKGTQSELFLGNVSPEEVAFEQVFKDNQLDYVFTNDKLVFDPVGPPGKKYNLLHLWRDAVNKKTALPVYEVTDAVRGRYIVMMPLGEPGVHLGENHPSKGSHLMVVKASHDGVITFNDFLPTTVEETNDFEFRMGLMDTAFEFLKRNESIERCGTTVLTKATELGMAPDDGIRDFLVTMIDHLPDKGGRPGFILRDETNEDIAENSTRVAQMLERVFTDASLKPFKAIQPPTENSQIIAHIHGFLLEEMPECMKETYLSCDEILEVKRSFETSTAAPDDEDDGAALTRTATVART